MSTPSVLGRLSKPGTDAPQRLVLEAARIFADKGFDAASTREICQAAAANVAAIHYHFGDKAGLYRAVLLESIDQVVSGFPDARAREALPLCDYLRDYLRAFLRPMSGDERSQWFARIHLREMLEPTPMMQDVIGQFVLPHYHQLVAVLARACGAKRADDELHRLAFAITALINDYCLSQPWMRALAPGLLDGDDALERTVTRLTGYACALVDHEARRRRNPVGTIPDVSDA